MIPVYEREAIIKNLKEGKAKPEDTQIFIIEFLDDLQNQIIEINEEFEILKAI
jgi:hypothetical protein